MPDYLIAYDIVNPKRLQRLHRFLLKVGVPIQYSIFYATMDDRAMMRCLDEAAQLIDPKVDDLRCYALPQRGVRARLGKASLPMGIYWTGLPSPWMG